MTRLQDTTGAEWKSIAEDYERASSAIASRPIGVMLEKANALLPFSKATAILDNGCGPAPVMSRLLKDYEIPTSSKLTCADFSEAMIDVVKKSRASAVEKDAESPWKRVEALVQNAMDLDGIPDASQSHVTAGWVYFMTPDPQRCLSESRRVLQDDGVLSCSAWEGSQWIDVMSTLPQIRPDKQNPQLPKEWSDADLMKGELLKAGFRDVEAHRVQTTMPFEKAAELAEFMLTKMPHMIKITEDFSTEDLEKARELWTQEIRARCAAEPGELTGVSLVAVGRK